MQIMNRPLLGVLCALSFVAIESLQYVYFGGLFQHMDVFTFGFMVFGVTAVFFLGWAAIHHPEQLKSVLAKPKTLIQVNLCAMMTFGCSLLSVQLIEPAITYTVAAGTMPVTAYVLHRLGMQEGEDMRNRTETIGNVVLFAGVIYLSVITLGGWSGFVRGDQVVAMAGVALSILDGIFFTLILALSQRLNNRGINPGTVLGLRLPLFVVMAGLLSATGIDQKSGLGLSETLTAIAIGLLVLIPPLYLVQKAVSMISTLTLSAITALGPFIIFLLQIFEGRVDYATATLAGLLLYSAGSLLSAIGAVKAATKKT